MTKEQFIRLFFIALLVFIVYQVFLIFLPFARTIFWAAILTFAFYPLYSQIRQAFGKHETAAAAITTILIFLIVIPPLIYLVINLTAQAIDLYQLASDYVRQGRLADLIESIRNLPAIQHLKSQSSDIWHLAKENGGAWLLSSSRWLGNFIAFQLAMGTKNILFVFINIILMSILTFIFLKDGEKIYQFVYDSAPLEESSKRPLFTQVTDTFSAVIRGQILTAIFQAVFSGFVFWFLGIPLPVLFATAVFFAALIPITGAATIWFPLCLFLYFTQHHVKAIILFVFGALVISLLDNLMKPAIIGKKTKLPYFLLFFGILGGLKVYGLMGIFLAPVILSLFFAMIRLYQEKSW
jgi:predicted PurR-regulated permease PerM